jgi:hypothetical protein
VLCCCCPIFKGSPSLDVVRCCCHFFQWPTSNPIVCVFFGLETESRRTALPVFRFRTSKTQATAHGQRLHMHIHRFRAPAFFTYKS